MEKKMNKHLTIGSKVFIIKDGFYGKIEKLWNNKILVVEERGFKAYYLRKDLALMFALKHFNLNKLYSTLGEKSLIEITNEGVKN